MVAGDRLLSAVLKGEKRAEDNARRIMLADMAHAKGWYATAARFHAEAIAADPGGDRRSGEIDRSDTTVPAPRPWPARGKAKDEPAPDTDARAGLRRQAVEWLEADLAGWSKILAAGTPEGRADGPAGAGLLEGRPGTGRHPR